MIPSITTTTTTTTGGSTASERNVAQCRKQHGDLIMNIESPPSILRHIEANQSPIHGMRRMATDGRNPIALVDKQRTQERPPSSTLVSSWGVLADWKLCAWQMMREPKRGVEAVVDRFDSHRDSYFMKTEEKTLAFQSKSHFRRGESTWAQWQSASDWVSDWVSCGWTGFRIQSLRRSSRSPLF